MRKRDGRGRAAWREGRKKEDDDGQKDTEEGETVDEERRRTGRVGKSRRKRERRRIRRQMAAHSSHSKWIIYTFLVTTGFPWIKPTVIMKKGISFVHQNPTCFAHTVDASLNNLWQFLCFLLFLFLNKKSQELTRENSYTVHFREPQPTLVRDEIKCSIIMRRPFTFTLHSSARFVWPVCRQCMFFGERKVKNASGFRFKPKCN